MERLGFVNSNGLNHKALVTHQNHFHVDLRAPERLDLTDNLKIKEVLEVFK